jgi:DHA3 family multidrug efflux protein-like MFS transporter
MKTFYQLLGNTLIASITNFTVWFAIVFFVYLETRSVFATSLLSGLYLVATASSGFWLGSLVDRFQKKQVMLISSIFSLVAYMIGFAIYQLAPDDAFTRVGSVTLWLFVPILLFGVLVGNIRNIALPTLVTVLAEEKKRDKANGLVGTVTGIGFMVTSIISGFLVGHSGMFLVLLLAMLTTGIAIAHLWTVAIEEKEIISADGESQKVDIKGTIKVIAGISGLPALILFATFNNFLGGVFMSLMDAYGLELVSVQVWGLLWGFLSTAFILGGLIIAKFGLGKNPLHALFLANFAIWTVSSVFTVYPSIILLVGGMFVYLAVVPYIEAAEHTIIQKLVPPARQGRVFGFSQSVEQAASPITAFAIGPLAQFVFIPFMTTGKGVELIGDWFGTGPDRGIALVFTLAGLIGLSVTAVARKSKYYRQLSERYLQG